MADTSRLSTIERLKQMARSTALASLLLFDSTATTEARAESRTKATAIQTEKQRIHYGNDASQFGDLSVPKTPGPHPVVVLIHGGCYLSDFDNEYLRPLADALNQQGYATWNIEYRRIGRSGGGWPQTFVDAGTALDQLRNLASRHRLDLSRVVTLGHSAGGQLALWLPERPRLPINSPIRGREPLKVRAAIGLGSITDLQQFRVGPAGSCHAVIDELLGGSPKQQAERYAQTSPAQLLPPSVPQWLIQGRDDEVVPATGVEQYAKRAGSGTHLLTIAGGHFEPVMPQGVAWATLLKSLREATAVNAK